MSQPDDDSHAALKRLDERLKAFKADDDAPATGVAGASESGAGEGYRLGETMRFAHAPAYVEASAAAVTIGGTAEVKMKPAAVERM